MKQKPSATYATGESTNKFQTYNDDVTANHTNYIKKYQAIQYSRSDW